MNQHRPHPCASHMASCDHCYLCDVVGICCATLTASQRAQLEAAIQSPVGGLRVAIAEEASTVPSLPELVRRDVRHPRALSASGRLSLSPAPTADPLSHESRKEPQHALSARSK